jgi:hypothetical protein
VSVSLDDLAIARLRQFFRDRAPVSLGDTALIAGVAPAWILGEIERPEQVIAGGFIPWSEVVSIIQRTWTPADLDAALGGVKGFPKLLHVSLVQWRLPAYLLVALEHIVAGMRGDSPENETLTVEAYVARQLDLLLDMDIVKRLNNDSAFREAFEFPEPEES